jgi:hypothetical protein
MARSILCVLALALCCDECRAAAVPSVSALGATSTTVLDDPKVGMCESWCGAVAMPFVACAEERCSSCGHCAARTDWCGLPAKVEQLQCGMIWYTHIARTGGTNVRTMLQAEAEHYNWTFHDSLFLTYAVEGRVPLERTIPADATWSSAPAWQAMLADLEQPQPRVIVHHHDGMPGLGNAELRTFLATTRSKLREQGCNLLMATVVRSPVTRAVSDADQHNLHNPAQLRYFTSLESDYQSKYLMNNVHRYETTFEHACDAATLAAGATVDDEGDVIYQAPSEECQKSNPTMSPDAPVDDARDMLAAYDLVGNTNQLLEFLDRLHEAITGDGSPPMADSCVDRDECEDLGHIESGSLTDRNLLHVFGRNTGDLLLLSDLTSQGSNGTCEVSREKRKKLSERVWERFSIADEDDMVDLANLGPNLAVADMYSGTPPNRSYHNRADNFSLPNLIYIKIPKTGSSSAGAIVRRLAQKHGLNGFNRHKRNNVEIHGVDELMPWGEPGIWASHDRHKELDAALDGLVLPKIAFSIVRDPTERCMSNFYYKQILDPSQAHNVSAKLAYLKGGGHCGNFQINYVATRWWHQHWFKYLNPVNETSIEQMLDENYDLIGIDSMFDETAVALAHLVGAPLQNVLYLRTKDSGETKDAHGRVFPKHIPFEQEPQEVKDYAASDDFREQIRADEMLFAVVKRRLDAQFQAEPILRHNLGVYKSLLRRAASACSQFTNQSVENCYSMDEGCGYPCLDELTSTWKPASKWRRRPLSGQR